MTPNPSGGVRKPYLRKMPAHWWLQRRAYFLFMVRELTAVFIGGYALVLLVLLWKLRQGPAEFAALLESLKSPLAVLFHVVALAMALYNSVTTFNAMPQVMPLRRGEDKLPAPALILPNYAALVVVSIVLMALLLKRS